MDRWLLTAPALESLLSPSVTREGEVFQSLSYLHAPFRTSWWLLYLFRQDATNRARKQEQINSKDVSSPAGTVSTPGLQKGRQKLFPAGKGTLCYSRSCRYRAAETACRQIGTMMKGGCRQVRARGQDGPAAAR